MGSHALNPVDNAMPSQTHETLRTPSTIGTQIWALTRRYALSLFSKPINSVIRIFIWPYLVLGICLYLLMNLPDGYEDNRLMLAPYVPITLKVSTIFIAYAYGEWMVRDRATDMKSLMISMGLKWNSYYLANSLNLVLMLVPISMVAIIFMLIFLTEGSESSAALVIILGLLFNVQLAGLIHALASIISSLNWSVVILLVLIFESAPTFLYNLGMKDEGFLRHFCIFLDTMSPYEPLRIYVSSYVMNKNSGIFDYNPQTRMVSAPTYILVLLSTFWTLFYYTFARGIEMICYCSGASHDYSEVDDTGAHERPSHIPEKFYETIRGNCREIGIRVSSLRMMFGQNLAVKDVSFSIYKGETTLLLGHNGAGKTTLMNIILGLLKPDSGQVSIQGYRQFGRGSLGVCPQTSILDDDLTVRQHLELFIDLKSKMSSKNRANNINQTIEDINLSAHADKKPTELSGGMKRKLSLGLAFIGMSNVLILDEPSSGLDPDSRVFVWNAIRRYREDRTVLLSTQHMEEADYLGDRVAIMSEGQIICCGSSIFLNRLFGTGYKLRIECFKSKQSSIVQHIGKFFNKSKLIDPSKDGQPEVSSENSREDTKVDFLIELQTSEDAEQKLIGLLESLENDGDKLGIVSHGLKSSSIEDVMLNTSRFMHEPKSGSTSLTLNNNENHIETLVRACSSRKINGFIYHLGALLYKILLTYINDWFTFIILRLVAPGLALYFITKELSPFQSTTPSTFPILVFAHAIYHVMLERSTGFKTIQLSSQISVITYWFAFCISELIMALVYSFMLCLFISTSLTKDFQIVSSPYLVVTSACITFHMAGIMFAYMLTMIMRDPKTAVGYFYLVNYLTMISSILITILTIAIGRQLWMNDLVVYVGLIFMPGDAFMHLLRSLERSGYFVSRVSFIKVKEYPISMAQGFLGLLFQIIFYTTLLVLAERQNIDLAYYTNIRNIYRFIIRSEAEPRVATEIDCDVEEETAKTTSAIENLAKHRNSDTTNHSLLAHNLSKSYIRNIPIVQKLSFTVQAGECFGLLGVNGAGKTTTFSMISVETKPDSGIIWSNGFYAHRNMDKYRENMGYDPQASPELLLTAHQALYLMARLRGVPKANIPILLNSILELLEMNEHRHKLASKLSGGTKRKLTLAMSLIGIPKLLALDEPTAGVDPVARRGIWSLLKALRRHKNSSIVISSHAMEECEAICDRISIMARGQLRCIGTFLHLRSKFARGCTLRVQLSSAAVSQLSHSQSRDGSTQSDGLGLIEKIVSDLQEELGAAIGASVLNLTDKNFNSATFSINDNRVRRSIVFRVLREFRQKHMDLNLSYVLNDASLEDIFISLAREQSELDQRARFS